MLSILLASLALAEPVHVQASLLNARAEPAAESSVVAWLRIGTAVEVLDESGEWVQVQLADRPEDYPVRGWVLGRFLDVEPPTAGSIRKGWRLAQQRGNVEAEATWTDRAEALKGGAADSAEPVHIGVCDGRRVDYLGLVNPDGSFEDRSTWQAPERQALMHLSALHWTEARAEGAPAPIAGSPFVRPFATERWNEAGRSAFAPGSCDGICDDGSHVVLGPCDAAGAVFTSQPVRGSRRNGTDEVVHELLEQGSGYSVFRTIWRLDTGIWSAEVELGHTEPDEHAVPPSLGSVWLTLPDGRELGVAPMRMPTVRGWGLLFVTPLGFEAHRLYVEGWGC